MNRRILVTERKGTLNETSIFIVDPIFLGFFISNSETHLFSSLYSMCSYSNVFQLPEGRMLSYFGIVPEGSFLDVPNAALGTRLESFLLFHTPYKFNVHSLHHLRFLTFGILFG